MKDFYPRKGEYIFIQFSPSAGHEQQGHRPAIVISENAVNKRGLCVALPITNTLHGADRYPLPSGEPVQGAVLFVQMKTLDWRARPFTSKGMASEEVMGEIMDRVCAVIGA